MKSVGIAELPAQALAQSLTQRGLAGAGHSHDDEKHGVRSLKSEVVAVGPSAITCP